MLTLLRRYCRTIANSMVPIVPFSGGGWSVLRQMNYRVARMQARQPESDHTALVPFFLSVKELQVPCKLFTEGIKSFTPALSG